MLNFETILNQLKNNEISHVEYIEDCINKIEKINQEINAIVKINENSIEDAKKFDEFRKNNKIVGILHGLPILIKDTIETKDLVTTVGSMKFKDYRPENDAEIVKRLKHAGAIIIGKSNTPQMSLDVQTFNSLHGVTNNPWDLKKTPGGSSGGSAAAIASGMVPLAIGSDLAGSLRIPSSFCGITSLRPTEGRIPFQGHIPPLPGHPIPSSEIAIGPMAKTTLGIEMIMQAMSGQSYNLEYPDTPYVPVNSPNPKKTKLAITTDFPSIPTDNRIIELMETIPDQLKKHGIKAEFDSLDLPLRSINQAHETLYQQMDVSKFLDNPLKVDLEDKSPKSSQILTAMKIRDDCRILVNEFLNEYSAWIVPVISVLPFYHNPNHKKLIINNEKISYWKATVSYSIPFSLIGFPIVTIPIGTIDNLPIGIQVIGKRWQDEYLVAICRILEGIFGQITPSLGKIST